MTSEIRTSGELGGVQDKKKPTYLPTVSQAREAPTGSM